tara:strand:+ start:4619 stop:4996 length:378 start_codon:yes stop_codon:yes gene_type:complete
MRSLPFVIDQLNGGFMLVEGILSVKDHKLFIEFQKKDAVVGAYKSDLSTIEIPFSDIDMMEYKKGFFSSKLIIHGKNARALTELPGDDLTVRALKVKKKNREIAANISSKVNLELSEMKLRELDG